MTWFESGQHRHLSAAFYLKDTNGLPAADHVERRGILRGDSGHGKRDVAVIFEQIETAVEMGESAQTEEVDFEKTERLHVVFVPLYHRAILHRTIFDGHEIVNRLVSQEKSSGMDGKMPGKIQDITGELEQMTIGRDIEGQSSLLEAIFREAIITGEEASQAIDGGLGEPQGLSHVPHRRLGSVADDDRHHGRPVPSVLFVDMLNDFFPSFVFNIKIDIRRFSPFA